MELGKGDRVYVKDEHEYGYITGDGSMLGVRGCDFRVRLDGVTVDIGCNADDLLPVETADVDGVVHLAGHIIYVGDTLLADKLNHGDEVRVTVERIKR